MVIVLILLPAIDGGCSIIPSHSHSKIHSDFPPTNRAWGGLPWLFGHHDSSKAAFVGLAVGGALSAAWRMGEGSKKFSTSNGEKKGISWWFHDVSVGLNGDLMVISWGWMGFHGISSISNAIFKKWILYIYLDKWDLIVKKCGIVEYHGIKWDIVGYTIRQTNMAMDNCQFSSMI